MFQTLRLAPRIATPLISSVKAVTPVYPRVTMTFPRIESILWWLMVFIYLFGVPTASAEPPVVAEGFAKCKVIDDNQARLDCIKKLLASSRPADQPIEGVQDRWPLVVTPAPSGGGHEAVSIMRTADTARSDPDLAGLVIRCQEKPGLEVLLALVRPLPPQAQREVVVNPTTTPSVIHSQVSSLGTGVVLPLEPTMFTTGPWRDLKEFSLLIHDPEADIRGVIPLDGLAAAIAKLSARCPAG
jgi:hypothetical protein